LNLINQDGLGKVIAVVSHDLRVHVNVSISWVAFLIELYKILSHIFLVTS
jgi:hypothetical protein